MNWINKDNLLNITKKAAKHLSEISTVKDFAIMIACVAIYIVIAACITYLWIWLIISFFYYLLLPLPVLIIEGIFSIGKSSSTEAAIGGGIIWASIGLVIVTISWIFTGRPPLISILFRVACLCGIAIGITLLVNKYIIFDALQYADMFLHEFILKLSKNQAENSQILILHMLESLRYFDTLIHDLIDISPENSFYLIGGSIFLGFLSELSSGIQNNNIITINTASAEDDENCGFKFQVQLFGRFPRIAFLAC